MRFLLATSAHNDNVQHLARALHEAGALGAYHAGGVDHHRRAWARRARRAIGALSPALDERLRRRRVTEIPESLIHSHWGWEGARALAGALASSARWEDRLWERGEHHLDRVAARLLDRNEYDAFFGVEHGCLAALAAARRRGRPSVVAVLSPHHSLRRRWVEAEYARFPELLTPDARHLDALSRARDQRRDREAGLADLIYANSRLTARSLIAAGIAPEKILTVPLGAPPARDEASLPSAPTEPPRIVYAGSLSVPKGVPRLLQAWRSLGARGRRAELHLYGRSLLPNRWLAVGDGVAVHGPVSRAELFGAFRSALVLVLPTLADGWGAVVSEALAHGLPVIASANAGAADLIEEGRNGFVVPPADTAALAERLAWCLDHAADLLAMRPHALATAGRWTWTDFRAALRAELALRLGDPSLAPTAAAEVAPAAGRPR